ncbi:hypothetical protein E2C01_059769 [Portunus trituberculatus]|uniref:Uncharacterized protein n=1 Tax=Portunus trituberculatus TaxID=210409 RepID=A0A5B7H092_PORTR|nr:hypothetical protein [Portunus trituberculatus]
MVTNKESFASYRHLTLLSLAQAPTAHRLPQKRLAGGKVEGCCTHQASSTDGEGIPAGAAGGRLLGGLGGGGRPRVCGRTGPDEATVTANTSFLTLEVGSDGRQPCGRSGSLPLLVLNGTLALTIEVAARHDAASGLSSATATSSWQAFH